MIVATAAGELHVADIGDGPPLLFWPSLFLDAAMWADQVAALSETYRCILIDPPGQGASAPLTSMVTLTQCGDALVNVMDELRLVRASVVGCSWGGMAAINAAARYPQRISAIAVLNSAARAPRLLDRAQASVVGLLLRHFGFAPWLCSEIVKGFLSPAALASRPNLMARLKADLQRQDPSSCAWSAISILGRRAAQLDLLLAIECPALVVSGGKDLGFPPSEGRALSAALSRTEFVEIANAGHLAPVERPDAVNALLKRFFEPLLDSQQVAR